MVLKDAVLDDLVKHGVNVAQHVSYGPDGKKRFCRIRGVEPTHRFTSIEDAVQTLMDKGGLPRPTDPKDGSLPFVNIRTFRPEKPDGNPFPRGRKEKWPDVVAIANVMRGFLKQGYHVIINEDIDINDGGFSGVVMDGIVEIAPCDTPRCVEKPGCAIMSRLLMDRMVQVVYGHRFGFPYSRSHRIEFSKHPGPVGYLRHPHIVWQEEKIGPGKYLGVPMPYWPNRLSEVMGDKPYGLLMAFLHGLPVPYCRASGRIIPPFEFGEPTGSEEPRVVRSCPKLKAEGKFFTNFGWLDIPTQFQREDPAGTLLASYIEQDHVDAQYSGKVLTDAVGKAVIEGTAGRGDSFMLGTVGSAGLPTFVADRVRQLWEKVTTDFGPAEFEWVYDIKNRLWLVQLHVGKSASHGNVIVDGDAPSWKTFTVPGNIEEFRKLVQQAQLEGFGIMLAGDIGITSHPCGILRDNRIPSRLVRP